ncbi:MAG: J domain-containing protein [Verrucomicrobiota bacterium]
MSTETIDAYPLCWPEGWKRTPAHQRVFGQFKGTPGEVQMAMVEEVERLVYGYLVQSNRSLNLVVSTNIPVRQDGLPYVNARQPEDPGVAVYFDRKGKQQCFACDKYNRVWKNMRAIQKTIEALRGIERWGSSDMLERAFTGFAALPPPMVIKPWWEVIGVTETAPLEQVKKAYRKRAMLYHADANQGREDPRMAELNAAYEQAIEGRL